MNPDPGWAVFLFQHGWGGFFGAVVGAVMMWPVPHYGSDTVVVKSYENLLGMTHAGFPSGAPWEWVFIGGFVMAGFFTYLANSSFVMIGHWGLTPTQFSLAFSLNAAGFIGASQFTGVLGDRFGLVRVVRIGAFGAALMMVATLAHFLTGGDRIEVLIVLFLVSSAFAGLVVPTTAVLALEEHGTIAGTASALMGTLQMLTGAVAMSVVGLFTDGRPLPMVIGMASGMFIALGLTIVTLGRRRTLETAAG